MNMELSATDPRPPSTMPTNFELLETLTSDQVEAIENIGIEQAQSGRTFERDELEVQLLKIPGLTEHQINAVVELELLTRA